jgi:hypothetical protein
MSQTVNDLSPGRHLAGNLPENEGVKCEHQLVLLRDLLKWDKPDRHVGAAPLLGLYCLPFESVNVGFGILCGY